MLLAPHIVAIVLAAACPSNVANDLRTPAPADAQQLVTVEAGSTETSYATARIWQRVDGCWASAGGPFGKATSGCISLRRAALLRVLRWLSPTAAPRIVIGTHAGLLG